MTGVASGNIDYQSAARTYFSKGIQSNAQYYFETGNIDHKMQLGVRLHIDQADRYATKSVYAMTNGTMILTTAGLWGNQENQIRNAAATSTFFSYDITYKGLKISPGVRYEDIRFDIQNYGNADNGRQGGALKSAENTMSIILPGIGLNYDVNAEMRIFGGIHKGFSPPGMPSITSTTSQAQVETALNYELGYRYYHKALNMQLVGFYSDYDNILGSDNVSGGGAGTGDLFNAGNAKVTGLEMSIEYDPLFGEEGATKLPINIAYTYTNARFKETFVNAGGDWGNGTINTNDLIPFITPHLLAVSVGYESSKFNTTLSAKYVGTTRTKPGQDEVLTPSDAVKYADVNAINPFMIVDLSSNYSLNKTFGIFATINNITNNKSIVANLPNGYRSNMPISFTLGIKAN